MTGEGILKGMKIGELQPNQLNRNGIMESDIMFFLRYMFSFAFYCKKYNFVIKIYVKTFFLILYVASVQKFIV